MTASALPLAPVPQRRCKGCRPEGPVTAETIAVILAGPRFQAPGVCVPDDVYGARLEGCRTCPALLPDGLTCSLCGCLVPVMAKTRQRSCPQPGAPRWGRYTG